MRPLSLKVDSKRLPVTTQGEYLQYAESVRNTTTNNLASLCNRRNHLAPAQERGHFIPSNERGRPRLRHIQNFIEHCPCPAQEPQIYRTLTPLPRPPTPLAHHHQDIVQGPYDSLLRNKQLLPPTPCSHSASGNSDLIGTTSQIYLPEFIYLGVTASTRNHTELHIFKQHCLYLLQHQTKKHISHPLTELQTITPHIGAFNKFFWKYCTLITVNGILEDYRGILHQSDTRTLCLVKVYTIFYSWDNPSYTVTLA